MRTNTDSEKFFSKFTLGATLGYGAFSEVKIGICKESGKKFAIKIVDKLKCKGKEDMVKTEVEILTMIKHQNIVQLFSMFDFNEKIYLVMELVTGGELFDEIMKRGTFIERDAATIVQKILKAIKYLHSHGIVHRDLKPENLLISESTSNPDIKISDFGLSKIIKSSEMMKTACGTPGYVAPEVLKKRGYGSKVDLWSLGVITYILLSGYPPFFDPSNPELFRKIMAGRFQFDRPWWDNTSATAKDFICKLLIVDPERRWTAEEALNHPFIVENCQHMAKPPAKPSAAVSKTNSTIFLPKNVKVPTSYPSKKFNNLRPFQQRKEQNQEKYKVNYNYKSPFSSKVNRIASWFRSATLAEKKTP